MPYRACAATSSLLLAAIVPSGCSPLGGDGSKFTDISKLPSIPQGQKQQLIQQIQFVSDNQKKRIAARAVTLNDTVGAQPVDAEPNLIVSQQFKPDPKGQTVVNKSDMVYQMISATDFWRLGDDTYNLHVEQNCEYYSSWTMDVEDPSSGLTYT